MLAHRFDPVTGFYAYSAEDAGHIPANATREPLPPRPWTRQWPRWNGTAWELIEDHRERKEPNYAPEDVQEGTPFWLSGDDWQTPARQVHAPGALPPGVLLARPAKPQEAERAERAAELKSELAALDSESIRALRAIASEKADEADRRKLAELESRANALRLALRELEED